MQATRSARNRRTVTMGAAAALGVALLARGAYAHGDPIEVASPSGRLQVSVWPGEQLAYSVSLRGKEIVAPSPIDLRWRIDGAFPAWRRPGEVTRSEVREELYPVVPTKRRRIVDHYNELIVPHRHGLSLVFRAYDDGVAYRWAIDDQGSLKVMSELATFDFGEDCEVWFPREQSMYSSQERVYERTRIVDIGRKDFASTGLLVGLADGTKVFLSEADLDEYPGMFLRGDNDLLYALVGKFANYPIDERPEGDRKSIVLQRGRYLAETTAPRELPWRLMVIAESDAELLESELVYKLAPECELESTDWIRPGKVAWDWWNDLNIRGVDFAAGLNTETYLHYIDFAAEAGCDYVILDEGWSDTRDLLSINPAIDLPQVIRHAEEQNVGVILWATWQAVDRQMGKAFDAFADWGVAGVKIDFMDRDDQVMVEFYHRVARQAARRKLLVDFHGSYKPTGLRRAFPNVLTREGVLGLEYNKWSDFVTTEHTVTLPFIRMVAGPLDFTPGAMRNSTPKNFRSVYSRPMSQGTRCHQLAMFVVYESPLQMVSDSPSNYREQPECLEFIREAPTVWDETRVLAAQVSDYVALARRSGDTWFIGAMTDGSARELELSLDFLGEGEYDARCWADGLNARRHAEDYRRNELAVSRDSDLTIKLAPGGGWAAILEPVADR